MHLQDYLATLSKDELLSLFTQLAEKEIPVRHFLEEKANLNYPQKPTSKVTLMDALENNNSISKNLVSRASQPQEKINLFKSLFVGRQEVFRTSLA